ncbi:MAG TPA: C25 family cysteine peptidase [Candidatus Thermoplasmatota archaeon]|nr:C25 family cysteine peptidase [Candidatus Thermoplasmatota archaeon]
MKKLIAVLILGVLLCSGLEAFGATITGRHEEKTIQTMTFAPPVIQEQGQYTLVTIDNTNGWLRTVGAPMLPEMTFTYTYPFGTQITNVAVTFSDPHTYALDKAVILTPAPVTVDDTATTITASPDVASFGSLYPPERFAYNLGAGIANESHVLYLTIQCYPVQYNEEDKTILVSHQATVTVSYELPAPQPAPTEEYKLVILAPSKFSAQVQPLVVHKISHGITTKLVTREDACNGTYFPAQGRDCAERIKYFIKDAFDQWGTRYVLLIGGRYGGVINEKWWMPVRYSHVDDQSNFEGSYLSDLYFADIYDANGNFSSWDPNENGVFSEWTNETHEIIDMYPDLYVGRLPCTSLDEVKTVVNKIINYENRTGLNLWFKRMVVVGGDSAPAVNDSWYEGEEENALALQYMSGFRGTKLWTSTGNLTGPKDVVKAVRRGCGFLFFDGHGNPTLWATHPPHNGSAWIQGLSIKNMPLLWNFGKLPVCVCGGCHNAQFNTSLLRLLKGFLQEGFKYFNYHVYYDDWVPECWAWKLVRMKQGGSIATMAYAGLDWFAEGDYNNDSIPDCVQFFSGFLNTHFFKNYGANKLTVLGQAYTQSLTDYLDAFSPIQERLDAKTVQEFVLLGDPSLQIGGYS